MYYIYVPQYIYIYIYTYICMNTLYICASTCLYKSLHVCARLPHTCTYIYAYIHTNIYLYVHTYINTYIRTYVCIYIHIYVLQHAFGVCMCVYALAYAHVYPMSFDMALPGVTIALAHGVTVGKSSRKKNRTIRLSHGQELVYM